MRGANKGGAGAYNRRGTPKVKDGKVQKKNRYIQSPNFYLTDPSELQIERQNPGKGYRHLLDRYDIERFIRLIPEWQELSKGLSAIVLATNRVGADGWHEHGVVHLCAWTEDLWKECAQWYFDDHADIFERLGVPHEQIEIEGEKCVRCFFDVDNAKAYQLMHILLHELGHHHDRITSTRQERPVRGENYAEMFARKYEPEIFKRYMEVFRPSFARRKKGR
jgi:hypothetical protein